MTFESPQGLGAQRHYLIQEAAAEMIRRDARSADVLSQLRSELQHNHLLATTFGKIKYRRRSAQEPK